MTLKVGCGGFPISKLKYYEKLKIVEVQQTFYRPLGVDMARAWRVRAPSNFEFTLKAWRGITHDASHFNHFGGIAKRDELHRKNYGFFKPTDEVMQGWERTEKIASTLKSKIIIFECPPSFKPNAENRNNLIRFFKTIKRKKYTFVLEVNGDWHEDEIGKLCSDLELAHSVNPFKTRVLSGGTRYFKLKGADGYKSKYSGWELKQLRDFCENEIKLNKDQSVYVIFCNIYMLHDALRFEWIMENTGRIRELDLSLLKNLCHEIDLEEEDEKVQELHREAERIVSLILHTDYARVDIEIEKDKLRQLCKILFPGKEQLYEMIYAQRFDRIWQQFREKKES